MSLSPEQVTKVAALARLDLPTAELAVMAGHLNRILDFVDLLKQVDTTGVEPMAHPIPVENVFRADELGASLPVDAALANAPVRMGDYFAVPAVFETE